MPFPEGTPLALKSLYGIIEQSVSTRENTAQLYQRLRSAMGVPEGGKLGFSSSQVAQLRSLAAATRNAGERLSRLSESSGITGREVSPAPWSRSETERSAVQKYVARVELLVTNTRYLEGLPGEPPTVSQWTSLTMSSLPATKGDLTAAIRDAIAQGNIGARKGAVAYSADVEGIGNVQLLTV